MPSRWAMMGSQIGSGFSKGMEEAREAKRLEDLLRFKSTLNPKMSEGDKMRALAEGFANLTPEQRKNLAAYKTLGAQGAANPLAGIAELLKSLGIGGSFGGGGDIGVPPPGSSGGIIPSAGAPASHVGVLYDPEDGAPIYPETQEERRQLIAAGALTSKPR